MAQGAQLSMPLTPPSPLFLLDRGSETGETVSSLYYLSFFCKKKSEIKSESNQNMKGLENVPVLLI